MHETKKYFPGLFRGASLKMSHDPKLTELLLGLSLESRRCSTGDPGHLSPAFTKERRQDDRDSWEPRPLQAQTQNDAPEKKNVCFDLGKESLWGTLTFREYWENHPEDLSGASRHSCSPTGALYWTPGTIFLKERLLNTGMRCSGGWCDLHSWKVWRLLSRFPLAGMKAMRRASSEWPSQT